MGEAEKIDTLSEPETQGVGKPEAIGREDIFRQLEALIDRSGFDLRGKIKKSKEIDKPVRDEMLGHIDEALGLITNFRRDGFSEKPAGEAADYFDVLQKMGEEHIPGFEKELTEYNGKIEAENSTPRLVVDNVKGAEKNIQTPPVADAGGREMAAVEKSEDEFKGESPLFSQQAERFNDVKEAGEVDMTKIEKSPVKRDGGKEPPGGDVEKLKEQLDAAYKELYGFLNDKKEAPKEVYDLIRQTENDLRGVVRFRNEVSDLAEQIKEKYKKDERSEEEKAKKGKKSGQEAKGGAEKEPGKKTGYTQEMVAARAAEIKQRRIDNQPGFEWAKIDALLRENKIEPGMPEAEKFLVEWDEKIARQELVKEEKDKKAAEVIASSAPKAAEEKRDYFKITSKKEVQDKKAELPPEIREILVSAVKDFRQQLQTEAAAMEGWEKYKPEQQKILLEIEVESFLRKFVNERLVPRGLVAKENTDAVVADLLNEKSASPTVSALPSEKVKAPETVVEKKDISVDFSAMTDLYNQEGDEFQKKYADAIKGFGVANSTARRKEPTVEPEFAVDSNPGLWGVLEGGQMLVFPKKGQDFNSALIVRAFAMNKVFDWSGTMDSIAKGIYKVIKPAIFASDGDKWKIAKKGKLEF